jgi:TP901 family phage tail tape measure protein
VAVSTREVLLLLRAREDASRALHQVQRGLLTVGAAADAASARAQAAALRARAEHMRVTGATAAQIQTVREAARRWDAYARSVEFVRRRLVAQREMLRQSGEAIAAFGVAFGAAGVAGLIAAKSWIDTAVEYERQVRHTRTQVDRMAISFEDLHRVGLEVARDLPVRFEEIQPALFDIFSSMEVGLRDAEILLRAFSKAAVAGQVDIQAVSRATIGLMNAFKVPASDVNRILDLQFELVQEGIGTYEEWNQRIGLVTPSAIRAGQSIETMVAALAVSTRMGISAARSGTAVARAMDAMSHPRSVKNMEELGIKVRDAHGNFLPLNVQLRNFRDYLRTLPPEDRVGAILEVFKGAGGTIEARRFLQNILLGKDALEQFDNILAGTVDSAGNMERAYQEMAGGVASQTELLRNKWTLLKEALGRALMPAFAEFIEILQQLLDAFNNLPQGAQTVIGQFILWGSVIGIVGGALLFIIGTIAIFAAAIASVGSGLLIAGAIMGGIVLGLAGLGAAFFTAWQKSSNFRDLMIGLRDNLVAVKDAFGELGTRVKEVWDDNLGSSLEDLADTIDSHVLPAIDRFRKDVMDELLPRLREAARIMGDLLGNSLNALANIVRSQLIPAIQELTKWWNENEDAIQPILGYLAQLVKWFLIVVAIILGTVVGGISVLIISFRLAVSTIMFFVDWVKFLYNAIKALIKWLFDGGETTKSFSTTVRNSINTAGNVINGFKTTVTNAFSGAIGWLRNAGTNIVQGLINGIRGAIPSLTGVLAGITSKIPDWKGPRERDRRLLIPAGQHIMRGLQRGIAAEIPALRRTLSDVTALMAREQGLDVNGAGALSRVGVGAATPGMFNSGTQTTNNFNMTVHTNDQDPRALAQQLGWEIANRIG